MVGEREACIILNLIPGIGIGRYRTLVEACGSAARALEMPFRQLESLHGFGCQTAGALAAWRDTVRWEEEINSAASAGVEIITIADPGYPEHLRFIPDPPLCIYVKGELPPEKRSIAIVGSRRMSAYGKRMAEALSRQAVEAGWWVVSGLAYGIDGAAHAAAVAARGRTAAVLGSGLARIHPREHSDLATAIIENGGALISEYPLFATVNRRTLPRRNRLISALSRGVCVVEAGADSGALITAGQALEQGRPVFAVPGHADNVQAAGSNGLIKRSEAALVENFSDILGEFGFDGGGDAVPLREAVPEMVPGVLFDDPSERRVLEVLRDSGPCNFDLLVGATGIQPAVLTALLMKLEMSGRAVRLPGRTYALK